LVISLLDAMIKKWVLNYLIKAVSEEKPNDDAVGMTTYPLQAPPSTGNSVCACH
jgi:hypothetical protein